MKQQVNHNGGISISDGYSISGIPMMIPDQQLVARHGTRQIIPEFSQDSFRPSLQDSFPPSLQNSFPQSLQDSFHPCFQDFFLPSFQDSFRPSFHDSRHPPTSHFVYAPHIDIQNIIPDYQSNSRNDLNEPRMHRMGQPETNRYKMEGGRNSCDDRTFPDQRKYPGDDADIDYNPPRHHPHFDENRRYPSYRSIDDPAVVPYGRVINQSRIPPRPQHEAPPNYRVSHSLTNRRRSQTAIIEDDLVYEPTIYDHPSPEHSIGNGVQEKGNEKSSPEPADSLAPYYEDRSREGEKQPETYPGVPEGDLPDLNGDRTPEVELYPEDQLLEINNDMPATVSLPGYDGDQPEGDITEPDYITEHDYITKPAEEIAESVAVQEQDQVTGGTTEGNVYPPSSEVDRKGPQAPITSIFTRLFPKRGRKNKKIKKNDYQPAPDEANEKEGNVLKNTREIENKAESNLANKEVMLPKLSDANKGKSDKPASASKVNPEDTKSSSAEWLGEKKPLKNKVGNLKADIKKHTEVAKAKLQKAMAGAKGRLKKVFKKPKIKNPFKKKK